MSFFQSIRGDIFGGLTAGVVALPLALAFGVASGAGAAAGLYGAAALGLFAAISGGTKTQISGPTGPMTVVAASALLAFQGDLTALMAVVFVAGAIQIALGCFKLGGVVKYIPYPVISGFMSGIGVIIILLQLPPLLGAAAVSSPVNAVLALPDALANLRVGSLFLSLVSLGIVFFIPARISRIIPSPLIALLVGTIIAVVFGINCDVIGAIPAGLPDIHFPGFSFSDFPQILGFGVALSLLGAIDTLLTSIVADSMTKTKHNSNRELIGQGIGNMICSLVGGLAGAGATMRTVVNIKAGGSTRISGVIHALFLLAVLLGLGPLAAHIPMPVLAGILMKVGVDILDYRLFQVARRAPKADLTVAAVVFGITVFVDLIIAVFAGVALASLFVTWRVAKATDIQISESPEDETQLDIERRLQKESDYQIRVVSVRGPFFFGSTAQMQDKIDNLLGCKVIVIDCLSVPFVDISAVFALCEMMEKLLSTGIQPLIVASPVIEKRISELGCATVLGDRYITNSIDEAFETAKEFI
ncbi:SulP family inorganic anion transporter [Desulfovibrio inopinatus]|uniref:SulP family inorganic anion transporter n=1 Tax=Desulfovibrio inopinatus TaxID=102109 RepID=UPI0003F533BC|nr:SulP family inorganic anion transporter [Desulfovibrio inopinatus]